MADRDAELEEARAALAPTLEATAGILPWLAKPRQPRFPPATAGRWQAVCERLAAAWGARHGAGLGDLRPAIFELYAAALELADRDCLHLAEALASATDALDPEQPEVEPRLAAALAATFESLAEQDGLEHPAFAERARHFAARLERCSARQEGPTERSPVLDRLFAGDAGECLERMHEGLALLPPDAYAIKLAAGDLARHAQVVEFDAIAALAGELVRLLSGGDGGPVDLDTEATRARVLALIGQLEAAVAAI